MHYKDGTEVKLGDVFKYTQPSADPSSPTITTIGQVLTKHPSTETCNIGYEPLAQINELLGGEKAVVRLGGYNGSPWSATAKDCERIA